MNKTLEELKEDEIYYNEHITEEYKQSIEEYTKETNTIEKIITIISGQTLREWEIDEQIT